MKRPYNQSGLRRQVPHEPSVVLLPDAGSHPEAVVVKLLNAPAAVVAVLRAQTLPRLAVLAVLADGDGIASKSVDSVAVIDAMRKHRRGRGEVAGVARTAWGAQEPPGSLVMVRASLVAALSRLEVQRRTALEVQLGVVGVVVVGGILILRAGRVPLALPFALHARRDALTPEPVLLPVDVLLVLRAPLLLADVPGVGVGDAEKGEEVEEAHERESSLVPRAPVRHVVVELEQQDDE